MVRGGYKQTEVGVIPEDWCITSIGELNPYITSGSRGWADYYSRDGSPFIRITNMSRECINLDLSRLRYVNLPSNENEGKRTELKDGDLLISITADIGISSYVDSKLPKPAYINQHVSLVRLDPSATNPKFVSYFLASEGVQKLFLGSTDQGAKAGLNLDAIRKIEIAHPTIDEQKAIAKALSDVDELIVSLEKLIAKKRDIKTATMQQLLTGKKRLPGFGEGKGYKQTELGEIPEDWDVNSIREIAKITRGASPRPIDSPVWFDRNSNIGWLRISDVTRTKKYLYETTQNLSEKGVANSRFVPSNNLVMSICATVGRPIITLKGVCIHDGFVVFSNLGVNMEYLYYVLADIEDGWSKHGQTGSQMNLNTGLINNTGIALPNRVDEQAAIAKVLSNIDLELTSLYSRLNKTKAIKQGVMQELLTGRTRLVDVAVTSKSKVA